MAARHTRLRQYPRRRAGGSKTPPKRRVAVISPPLYRSLKSSSSTSSDGLSSNAVGMHPVMSLSYTLNPSSLTSFPNSGGMLPVSCQQFHGASCGSNPRERARTYRIANFSLGGPNISSRATTLDKPHDLMFSRERPSPYRPTCEHSNKSRSASSHHPSQVHR